MTKEETDKRLAEVFGNASEEPEFKDPGDRPFSTREPAYQALKTNALKGDVGAMMLLAKYEQSYVPNGIHRNIEGVKSCSKCGSSEIDYTVIYGRPKMLMIRAVCRDCGYEYAVPHVENLKRRTNSTLAKWRCQVLRRDEHKCRICGSEENLEAHHIIPVSADKEGKYKYDINNGITLCRKHHAMVHPWMLKDNKDSAEGGDE